MQAPRKGTLDHSGCLSLCRNVGLMLPDLLMFQKKLEFWILQ